MRTTITSIDENENNEYNKIFESLDNKFKEELSSRDIKNPIISYENLIEKTCDLLKDNFITSSEDKKLYDLDVSYESHSFSELKVDRDEKIDSIFTYADNIIPAFEKDGIYDTESQRWDEVKNLAKIVTNTIVQYSNGLSFDDFNNVGRKDSDATYEGMNFAYNSAINEVVGSLESYGFTEQNHKTDMRAAVMINTNNYLTGLVDRLFDRVSAPTGKIQFNIQNIIKYDYAKNKSMTATERDSDLELSYVELNKDPSSINTKSMPVEFTAGSHDWTFSTGKLLKINNEFNIFDATRSSTKIGFDHAGESDRLSEGGKINNIYVEITTAANVSRVYKVNVKFNDGSYFTKPENMKDGSQRIVNISLINHPIVTEDAIAEHRGSGQDDGDADHLAAITGGQAIAISGTISGTLNLRTGVIEIVTTNLNNWDVIDTATGATSTVTASTSVKTAIAGTNGKIEVVAYDMDLQFTEENIRKATVGIRTNNITKVAKVPHGKTYIFETQALPNQTGLESLIDTSKNIIGLGNADKTLTIIEDFIDNGVTALKVAKMQPKSTTYNNFNSNFVSSNKILPAIMTKTISFDQFANRRELEKTHDAYAVLERELKSIISKLDEDSCYSTVLSAGEKTRYVAVTHNRIIQTIISPMTPNSQSEKPSRSGMHKAVIQVGQDAIVEFHGVSFDDYVNKMWMVPVRQSNRGDTTSFAINLDVGTFLGNFISGNTAVSKKHIINSREIIFITTPVAAKITFEHIDDVYPDLT